MKVLKLISALLLSITITSCSSDNPLVTPTPTDTSVLNADLGIEAVPSSLGSVYTTNFNRYTKVVAPNGKPIHIVAQSKITNEQIVRCRSILEHYLKNLPRSVHGSDKSAIANKMADNGAILDLKNGRDDGSNTVQGQGQPLFEKEIQVEGHLWYTNQDFAAHRDASYEEILHMVHDKGIGVDGANTTPGAAPAFQTEIRAAQVNASAKNLWGVGLTAWIAELTSENSLSQEYLVGIIDAYYGLSGADSEGTSGYTSKTRAEIPVKDPIGNELVNSRFFHPHITYNARIDSTFSGTFSLKFDTSISYTNHSRYLKDITLLGSKNTNVTVNELSNNITGNKGSNIVIFSGNKSQYTITITSGITTVKDNITNRDGTNILKKVEKLQFTNQTVTL